MQVRIGLLGYGNVGAPFAALVERTRDDIEARTGVRLELSGIAVRDLDRPRVRPVPDGLATDDAMSLVTSDDIDLIVEVMGGVTPAHALIAAALEHGKPVVTANKEVIAAHGPELLRSADEVGVDLLFEAAVGGGIPFIRPLRESLVGERILRVMGIVNGTTNFILDRMTSQGTSYADALDQAKRLGYAEPDPSADVEGRDSAAKAAIIASIAFGVAVDPSEVHCEGITSVDLEDIEHARRLGYVIKLLAITESIGDAISARVHPTLVPIDHPLASVHENFNAVFVEGESVGDLMFYGKGAGSGPTTSALLGDVIDAAVNVTRNAHASVGALRSVRVADIGEATGAHAIQLQVHDRPGVLAKVAGVFGANEVSIRSVEQEGMASDARLVFITHASLEADVEATLAQLDLLDEVKSIGSVLRVVGTE